MRHVLLQACLVVVTALACSGEKSAPTAGTAADASDAVADTGAADAGAADTEAADTEAADLGPATDVGSASDAGAPDLPPAEVIANCPGGAGCACKDNAECQGGLCIDDPNVAGGKACAQACIDSCPSGYQCAQVSTASGDVVSICVAKYGHLCDPCATSKDCAALGLKDSACVDEGAAGHFCGVACTVEADCPEGYGCQKVSSVEGGSYQQCVRKADATQAPFGVCPCSQAASDKKLATACFVESKDANGKVIGQCAGSRTCTHTGLTSCAAPASKPEVCNGQDDDCDGQTDEATCDDGKPCTLDVCDGPGGCKSSPLEGTPCDADGSICTENDSCKAGVCTPGAKKDCDDKNPCTADSCELAKGCTQTLDDGAPCSDDNPCTIGDVCAGGGCAAGKPKVCVSTEPCVDAKCDLTQDGKCTYANKKAGAACDDGNPCTKDDGCDAGSCGGQKVVCDDGNGCTDDSCDPKSGCVYKPNAAPCDDGNACTASDLCGGGGCAGKAGDPKLDCDDGQPCTTEGCDPKAGCTHAANQAPCDDGNPCTNGDVCADKACTAGSNICGCQKDADCAGQEDGDLCNGVLFCDTLKLPYTCKVKPASVVSCDKSQDTECLVATCTPATGKCAPVAVKDGKVCDDGSVCTTGDSCASGACQPGAAIDCNDQNGCTADACDPKSGCTHAANAAPCDDGNVCTQNDVCSGKSCAPGAKKVCDDGNACTDDSCDASQGCQVAANAAPCDDGNACTGQDTCGGGKCVGEFISCDDKNACTDDGCSAKTGCSNTANSQPCDADGSVCTVDDACKDKACAPGAKKPCDDGNACTDDGCDAKSGCNSSPNAAACDDKNICTDKDTCGGGSCAGAPVVCDDKDPCTADNCSALKGCVFAPVAEKTDCAADGKSWCVGGKCVAKQTCGNGVVETGEDCDGGPNVGNGACSKACKSNCAALDFDGKGSQVNLGQPAQLDFLQTSGFTIEVWFQADPVVDGNGSLVALGEGTEAGLNRMIHIDVLAGRRLQFMIRGSKGTAASSSVISPNGVIKPGQWHHVAAVRDKGKTLRLYLNGVLLGSAVDNPGETAIPQSVSWRIGTSDDTPPYAFKGRVGEVRFWSTAVLASELVARMNQVLDPGKFNQLQVYLPMQEGAGQTVKDVTDAPISGALSVGVQWVNACRPVCTPGTTECLGDQIATCNGQGSGFAAVAACPAQAPFCLAGQCLAPQPSCEAHLQANPKTLDGLYPIDPDGAGPIAAANLFCDMKNGGWTLVGNYYDAAGDDMPNTTDFVVSGWQQTGSGKWDLKAATVDRAWGGGTGSAAVSLAFVEALGKAAGQKNLKMCFVHQDGYDTTCRASFDGSLTLLGGKAANPKLDLYAASPLPFSFGRLAGLAGSVDGYSASNYVDGAYCVVRKPAGVAYEFGVSNSSDAGFCEYPSGAAAGVWSLSGYGTAFRPEATNDNELGAGAVGNGALLTNPLTETYGFRLYIGPDATLGSKSNPAKSCKAILDAKASLGDGSYWLDPDGPGPNAAVQTWCDMTRDGGGWTLVGLVHRANSYNVSEPKAWFTAGNNAGALAFQQETIDASPSAYAATTWQALLGAAGQARFDLHAHLDPAVRRSWYKTAQWQGFAEWFNNDSNASQVCTNVAMSQNCSSGTIGKVVNDRTELTGMNLNHYGYQTDCPLHLRLDSDLGASFSAVCSCTTNYNNNAWPDSGGDGHWGNGLRIWLRETVCGDGQTTVGEQCDDGNTAANDGCSATCQVEAMASCKDILAKFPAAPSGTYSIDPDGPGGAAAFAAACDMTTDGGGWTRLVAPMAASLKAGVDRAYLYSYNGRWYRSPKTQLVWGWASGQQLTGDYAWWNGSQAGSLTCNGSGEKPTFGIGCSNGGGGTAKVLLAYASDPNTGTGTVCQDIPNAFGGSVCQAGVATWVR